MKNIWVKKINVLFLLVVIYINFGCRAEYDYPCRMRRSFVPWLIVPPTAPTRHQLIVGFGIPVVLPDRSVTIGWVIKGQYFLPNCIDQLKPDFFWFNDQRSNKAKRSFTSDNNEVLKSENFTYYDAINEVNVERYEVVPVEIDRHVEKLNEIVNNTVDGEVPKIGDQNEESSGLKNSRWAVFQAIEGILSYNKIEGHECLLKTICEVSETKITYESGILGEIINVILTPSSTNDRTDDDSMDDYHKAELNGKKAEDSCSNLYPKCEASLSEIFSKIYHIMIA